nr:reverse transcriptase domain-containing protein [Tanacetum cinerariifolium]
SRNNSPQQEASPVIVEPLRIELPFLKDQFQEDPPPEFFPPSKTKNLRNEITRFQQRFYESFYEAWDRFNDLLRVCPHHGFSELHQLDTFYNALNVNDQDSLNSTAGGNFLDKMPRECLKISKSKSKVRQSRAKTVVAKVSMSSSTPVISSDVAELKDMVRALLLDKKNQSSAPPLSSTPAPVKAVETNCVTCGGTHSYQNCPATSKNVYRDNIQEYVSQAAAANYNQGNTSFRPQMVANQIQPLGSETLPSNTNTNPKEELKGITTRSGVAYQRPTIPTPSTVVKQGTKYPSRHDNERRYDQANEQIKKFYEIFKDMSFEISFTDALILMPKFTSALKALIGNKEKLSEMARTPMNEHCSAVILNKLPRKLGDPGKFLIPCEFPGMDECLALADLGASINLMPLSVWEALSLPELTPTYMTLELVDRSVSNPIGIAKYVSFKVVLGFSDVTTGGNPTPHDDPIVSTTSPTLTLFGDSDFLLFKEADVFLGLEDDPNSPKINPFYYDPEMDILLFEAILNKDYKPVVQHQRRVNPKIHDVIKKEVEKFLDAGLIYPIFDSSWVSPVHCVPKKGSFTVVENEENELIPTCLVTGWRDKTTFTCPNGTFAYRRMPFGLCNASGTFQMCMLAIFHDMVKKTMQIFMDDFSVFGNSFKNCLSRLDKMLQRCEDTNLILNYEKSYFMVNEGIVLGHKISKNGIEVDKAKVDVIAKLPHPTTVKVI